MIMFDPEHCHRNHPEGAVALGALVVAGGQAAELLAATNQVLHAVAPPVQRPIEGAAAALVGLARDGVPDAAAAARLADGPTAVAFVAGYALGAHARPPAAGPPHPPCASNCGNTGASWAWPGVSTRVSGLPPPSARRWTLVEKPPWLRPSASCAGSPPLPQPHAGAPAASAWRWTAARSWSQTPARVQRRKRVYTVCQGPYRSGRSRQGTPVASFQRMPLSIRRSSCRGRPGFRGGKSGSKRAHSVSLNSCRRRILHLQEHTDSQYNYLR